MTDRAEYLWTAPTIAAARLRAATLARMTQTPALIVAGPACFYILTDRGNWSDGLSPRAALAERMDLGEARAVLEAHAAAVAKALADAMADHIQPQEGV